MIDNNKIKLLICCRVESTRLQDKALLPLNGVPAITHLIRRLKNSVYEPILCTTKEKEDQRLLEIADQENIRWFTGDYHNMMQRMYDCAKSYGADHVVRVTGDDVLIDIKTMEEQVRFHLESDSDFTYTHAVPRGMETEVIRAASIYEALKAASYTKSEHVTYYMKNYQCKSFEYKSKPNIYGSKVESGVYTYSISNNGDPKTFPRLTMDYPEDYKLLQAIFHNFGNRYFGWEELSSHFAKYPQLKDINRMPLVTIFITNHNYERFIRRAIESVEHQTMLAKNIELIIIDDGSKEDSSQQSLRMFYGQKYQMLFHENSHGLTRSSNEGAKWAKGKYFMRLDADDWLEQTAVESMYKYAEANGSDIVYGDFFEYKSDFDITYKSNRDLEYPHPACSLVRKKVWEEIRYNENIRCQDGVDFFRKAKERFKIDFIPVPVFYYRKHGDSLSDNQDLIKTTRDKIISGQDAV